MFSETLVLSDIGLLAVVRAGLMDFHSLRVAVDV